VPSRLRQRWRRPSPDTAAVAAARAKSRAATGQFQIEQARKPPVQEDANYQSAEDRAAEGSSTKRRVTGGDREWSKGGAQT